jgi:cell division protein ZapE
MDEGPREEYRARRKAGELTFDPAQSLAVEKLQSLHHAIRGYRPAAGPGGWKKRFGLSRRTDDPPQGLYLSGGVGRGKSMLMDLFFHTAPVERKRRVHFHAFMQEVHCRLNAARGDEKRDGDPIPALAQSFAEEAWLLCFDEFQVLDITDAMILGRLFEALFDAGIVIVATSNRPPSDLYKDGLQRQLFLPFIELIEKKLDLLILDGRIDHRLESIRTMNVYLDSRLPETEEALHKCFRRLTNGNVAKPDKVPVQGREVDIPAATDGVAFANFTDLCERHLGAADYLAIARRYHTLVLSRIPKLSTEKRNEAKRLVILIDALYEHKVKLICSAAAQPEELYTGGDGAFEFKRTASRLAEMQTEKYLSAAHTN